MKRTIHLTLLLTAISAHAYAACPLADAVARKSGTDAAMPFYQECALKNNDDESQLRLARQFRNRQPTDVSVKQALFYYTYAADNGNATAQSEMADYLLILDKNADTRAWILEFYAARDQITGANRSAEQPVNLSPYALLTLAALPPADRWYFPSDTTSSPTAGKILHEYAKTLSLEKKQTGDEQVFRWKNQKMLDAARTVLTPDELADFMTAVFPTQGSPDLFTAKQSLAKLKTRIEELRKK